MRILLADDHEVVRRGLQMVLGLEKDFEIVGDARDGTQAVARALELRPDLVLMDLKMPGLEGSAATRQIKRALPETKVLILTGIEIDEEILGALEAGADGYVLKEVSPEELIHAIRVIGAGEAYLQPVVTKRVLRQVRGVAARPEPVSAHPALTAREQQVLQLMATSATNKEIAAKLSVSDETVRSHTKNILSKLDQPNRAQAVLAALREGLIDLD
jgi:DNA-binding NarL/FixJ family response regulator